jgi:hypothetical protein
MLAAIHPSDRVLARYAAALVDPRSAPAIGVPISPCYPSQKLKLRTQFTAYAGSDGWVKVVVHGSAANDGETALYSTPSSTPGGALSRLAATGDSYANNNSPYTEASFTLSANNGLDSRCVAIGLYWQYAGTVLNRGGTFYSIVKREHFDDYDGLTASTMATLAGAEVGAVDGAVHHMVWAPSNPAGWETVDHTRQDANANSLENGGADVKIGLLVAGNTGTAIQCQVVELWEVCGAANRASHTGTPTAPNAHALHGHLANRSVALRKDALVAAATGGLAMCAESPALRAIATRMGGAIEAAGRRYAGEAFRALGAVAPDLPMIGL